MGAAPRIDATKTIMNFLFSPNIGELLVLIVEEI
jgi:hypothetical protein